MKRRPSSLQLAGECGLASVLAEQYPEGGAAAGTGDTKHIQIGVALKGGPEPSEPDCIKAVEAVRTLIGDGWKLVGVEMALSLEDPETGEVVTEGTADLVMEDPDGVLWILDWKSGRPENVTHPSANLQLHAYGLAAALKADRSEYVVQIGHVVDGEFWWGDPWRVKGDGMWAYLDAIKSAAAKPIQARTGPHCDRCFQQKHCPSFMLPAYEGPTALAPFTKPGGLTHDNALQAILAVEALETAVEVAKARLKSFVLENGPIVSGDMHWAAHPTKGRRSGPTFEELEKCGLGNLIKPGTPGNRFEWRKIPRIKVA